MGRRNFPKNIRRDEQWRKEYVRIPEYPYTYIFKIMGMRINCINTCAYYFATGITEVDGSDHPLIDKLLSQI